MRFVNEHSDRYAVALLLRVLDIDESSYCGWVEQAGQPCDRDMVDLGLLSNIYETWTSSGQTYGPEPVLGRRRHPNPLRRRSVLAGRGPRRALQPHRRLALLRAVRHRLDPRRARVRHLVAGLMEHRGQIVGAACWRNSRRSHSDVAISVRDIRVNIWAGRDRVRGYVRGSGTAG
jgi:hypothetical protein